MSRNNSSYLFILFAITVTVCVWASSPPNLLPGTPSYFTVDENATIGSTIFQINATDPDGDSLTFSSGSLDTDTLVDLTQSLVSGNIYTCNLILKSQLDRDNSPVVRQLHIKIKDSSFEITRKISMVINDINDNPPTFTGLPYRFSLQENHPVGMSVFKVSATDPDTAGGGQIVFSMNASNSKDNADYNEAFTLSPTTGVITLTGNLDYEMKSFYHFKVYSRDNGNPVCPGIACVCTATTEVCRAEPVDLFITIIDVEDTPPVFEGLPYIKEIYESMGVGSTVMKLKASDGDRGVAVPNTIHFLITQGNSGKHFPFSINSTDETIYVSNTLDADDPDVRSHAGFYIFTVNATEVDGTRALDPSLSISSTQVSITVLDVNDNLPQFKLPIYRGTVQENTPSGAPLVMSSTIEVEDIDQTGNNMFRVVVKKDGFVYKDFATLPDENQIINGKSSITIVVANSSVLDYEVRRNISFQLEAEALDAAGSVTNTTQVTIVLQITDVNDNSPAFPSQLTRFNVGENVSVGSLVTQIKASDLDSGDFGTITFSLEDSESAFTINGSTGQLTVSSQLDRETRASYPLAIIATDSPQHPEAERRRTRLQIVINVTDINDNEPQWAQFVPYVTVLESTTVGTNVTELIATDRDEGLNGQIVFRIAPGTNGSTLFSVTGSSGRAVISASKSLVNNFGLRTLTVVATDRGTPALSSNVSITVFVVDENQNRPVFVVPDQRAFNESSGKIPEISVYEEVPIGSLLIQLSATDADLGLNGLVYYYLDFSLGPDNENFRLDRTLGNLTSVNRLDRENKDTYEIGVRAEDNGQPASLSSTIRLRVRLLDIDDNAPSYDTVTMSQTMEVTEETSPFTIGKITPAIDKDLNPITCYHLYSGDNITSFSLNKTTGNLTLMQKVDREKVQYLDIVIQASEDCNDTNAPQNNASMSYNVSGSSLLYVSVKVVDINDNPPQFVPTLLSTAVISDVALGTEVMFLAGSITDADTPENSHNMFKLLNCTLQNDETILDTNKQAFLVTINGTILTNIIYRSDIVGYFSLFVEAYDEKNQNDVTEVRIFVISNLQRVKLVFDKLPNQVEEIKNVFLKELSDILKLDLVIDKVVTHTSLDGTQDPTKTDAYIHGRELNTLNVIPASDLWRRFDYDLNARTVLYKYGVEEAKALTTESTDNSKEELKRTFAIVAAVLAIALISLLLVLIHLVRMYRHRLRAATTAVFIPPKEKELLEHPGTNKYYSSENPLFGKEIKPALMEDDRISNGSLDDNAVDKNEQTTELPREPEEQEVVLQINESPTRSPGHHNYVNYNSHLEEVLQAYENKAFDNTDSSNLGDSSRSNQIFASSLKKPKMPGEREEGITRFSDNFLSYDTGYQNGHLSTSGRNYTDI